MSLDFHHCFWIKNGKRVIGRVNDLTYIGRRVELVIAIAKGELGGLVGMHIENMSGPGPSRPTNQVKSVNLSGNLTDDKLGVGDLRLVGTLTSATHLHLSWTPTTNTGLDQLRWMTNLKHLSLEDTQITDAGLKALGGMHKMESLFVNKTRISSAGLKHLTRMRNLQDRQLERLTHPE